MDCMYLNVHRMRLNVEKVGEKGPDWNGMER